MPTVFVKLINLKIKTPTIVEVFLFVHYLDYTLKEAKYTPALYSAFAISKLYLLISKIPSLDWFFVIESKYLLLSLIT